jgi:WD40 repeat protein
MADGTFVLYDCAKA